MGKTFEDVNYRLRPAKSMERKMMADLLTRMHQFCPLSDYRYVGFGSPFFSDVKLFHKRLNVNDIISIEREEGEKPRFELNKPYDCVEMKYGHSKEVLPELDWESPTILWLDYTEELKSYMLTDIHEFITRAPAGSVLFVTVNTHATPLYELEERDESMLDEIYDNLSREVVPRDVETKDLRGWNYADTVRRIILNQIEEKFLPTRNSREPEDKPIEFEQLLNLRYQDSSKMMTFGGMLHSDKLNADFDISKFDDLFFVSGDSEKYKIKTPVVTFREMRELDEKMPVDPDEVDSPVPNRHVQRYADLYRYFPRFVESEL